MFLLSLPMRERGLKCDFQLMLLKIKQVAPHAGAWIEIRDDADINCIIAVAPHAGAWIEITCICQDCV